MNEREESQLAKGLNLDEDAERSILRSKITTLIVIIQSLIVIAFGVGFGYIISDNNNIHRENARIQQYVYNMTKLIQYKDRRSTVIRDLSVVIRHYRPRMSKALADELARIAYREAELKYNIPTEEIMVLITMESRWYYRATSSKGAKGLGQLMYLTASRTI
jgi:soluble lytic murein transglycosylase-like protein